MNNVHRIKADGNSLPHCFHAHTLLVCEIDEDLIGWVASGGGVEVELVATSVPEHD